MNKKVIWSGIAVLILIAIAGAYHFASVPKSTASPIKIGAVLSLTGFAAPWGEYAKNGIDLAVQQINASGGIKGRMVQVTIEDDGTDGKNGVSAWNKLVTIDGAQGIIGGVFDFTAQPLMPLAKNSKIPFISPSNFQITGGLDLNEQSFVMLTDFNKTILKLQPYLAASSIHKLAVVHYQSTFGNEIAKTLNGMTIALGRGPIIDTPYPQIGNNDWKTTILKLKGEGADGVFIDMVGNDPAVFLKQAKELGYAPTIITYNGVSDAFANQTDKSLLNGVVLLNWEITTPEFASLYQSKYGVPPTKSADKYFTAVYVMANALANSTDASRAASYIAGNSFSTPNGNITFTADHSVSDSPVQIQVIENGVPTPWVSK